MKLKLFNLLLVLSMILNSSCATGLLKVKYLDGFNSLPLKDIAIIDSSKQKLLDKMAALKTKLSNYAKPLSVSDYNEIINELSPIVSEIKKYKLSETIFPKDKYSLILPANSKLTLNLNTYCLSPHNAAPSSDEPFILINHDPEIPLYSEIMHYMNRKEKVSKNLKQNLLWNLKNQVKFENLPSEEQALLLRIDPSSPLKLNNFIKEELKEQAGKLLNKHLPKISKAKDVIDIVKGKVYKYEDYARRIESLKSKYKKPNNSKPIKAEGYSNIATLVKANGYSNAVITFINTSSDPKSINSYFKPLRKDVQPLGFDIPNPEIFYDVIKQGFGEILSTLASKLKPELGSGDLLNIENNPEKIIDFLKSYRDKQKAFDRTKIEFGYNGEDDISDAFRHAFWNSIMTRDVGYNFAKEIADMHELNPGKKESKDMDLWNNKIGRDIGQKLTGQGIMDDSSYAIEILKNKDKLRILK